MTRTMGGSAEFSYFPASQFPHARARPGCVGAAGRHVQPLDLRWCRQQGVQAANAPDVMQGVFREVFRDIGRFRRKRPGDSFRGWLWTVTRNRIRDHF